MGTVKTLKAKLIVILIVFMILFSNFGFTLSAIATSDEFEVINRGFFRKDEIKFDAYFEDKDGNKVTELTENVNENIKLVLEILPQVEGFLQDGKIKAVSADGSSLGFKFSTVSQNLLATTKSEVSIIDAVKDVEEEKVEEPKAEVEKTDDEKGEEPKTDSDTNTVKVDSSIQSILDKVSDKVQQADSDVVKTNPLASILDVIGEEILVDENVIVEDEDEKEETYEDKIKEALLDITIESENEILLSNIIEDTKIVVDLEFIDGKKLDINNLLEEIKLQLSGTFINKNLKEVKIGKEEKVTVGWEYSKDVVVSSEFTKFSPFSVMDVSGTIVQNDITITRNINDEKYLPIKSTTIEVDVPKINDQAPIEINVIANKTLATNGEDVGETTFTKNNWSYDKENNKIIIKTVNKEGNTAVYSHGEDQYVIIYRFKDYIKDEKYNLINKATIKVVEYSSDTKTITKKIDEIKEVDVKRDELLTSSIGTNKEKINKAKINANYNSDVAIYETEYKTQVRVNILTSDILENIKIDATKEMYKSNIGLDFEANEVILKKVIFNIHQIQEILSVGGEIVLKNENEEVIAVLNKDVIKEQKELVINLNGINGLFIELNNVKRNGTIDFELVKSIGKCEYNRDIFQNITHIESIVNMKVKYIGMSEEIQLTPMATSKQFEDSMSSAKLVLNKKTFSTTKRNANVEFKIELNNDKITSDLYVNPSFEIAFPKHVDDVKIQSINVIAGEGFKIGENGVYKNVDGTQRIKVDLEGVQTQFNSSTITNGTNIVINADVIVDVYTASKEDQVKLYYANQHVTKYDAQTKWSIIKNVPENILKQTNGYDAETIEFKGPNGLIAINTIKNFDGKDGVLSSFKQGDKTEKISKTASAVMATMELIVLNNTGTICNDAVLMGRIPFKGNTDVNTNEDLGTTVDTTLKSIIIPHEDNTNESKIYYSSNEKATRDLNKTENSWRESVEYTDLMKSYMIVIDKPLEPGAMLKYSYNFEIPANLGYEAKILGSFGTFYNKQTEALILKETTMADKVGLVTDAGVKLETKMSVNIGEDAKIGEARYMTYTIMVKNTGSIDLTDVVIKNPRPTYGRFCAKSTGSNKGDNGYDVTNSNEIQFDIPLIKAGETVTKEYIVKTNTIPNDFNEYCNGLANFEHTEDGFFIKDEEGNMVEIKEMPEKFYVENYAIVTAKETAKEYKTNVIKNELVHTNFDIQTILFSEYNAIYNSGDDVAFVLDIQNISLEDRNEIEATLRLPKEMVFTGVRKISDKEYTFDYNEPNNEVTVKVGSLKPLETSRFYVDCNIANMKNIGSIDVEAYAVITAEDQIEERGTTVKTTFVGPQVTVTQQTNIEEDKPIKECQEFEIIVNTINSGKGVSKPILFEVEVPEELKVLSVVNDGSRPITVEHDERIIKGTLAELESGNNASLIIKVRSNPLESETSKQLFVKTQVKEEYIGELEVNDLSFWIVDDPDRELTEEEKQAIADKNTVENPEATDDYKQDVEDMQDQDTNIEDTNKPTIDVNNDNSNSQSGNTNNGTNNSNNQSNDTSDNVNNDFSVNQPNNDQTVSNNRTYKISGEIWKDENYDGIKDDEEKRLGKVKVSLYQGNNEIKTSVTDSLGKYRFTGVNVGTYNVVFEYNSDMYTLTDYKKSGVPEDKNSDVLETSDGVATTNEINISDSDLVIDCGVKVRDDFDIAVEKYITKSIVKNGNKEKVTEYNNATLEKLEIRSKELNDTEITLEYKVVVSNNGNVKGSIGEVRDYIPSTLSFDETKNNGWQLGKDGVVYNNTLKDVELEPGDTKELKIVLKKVMSEDNTGTIVNKVEIAELVNENALQDNEKNNVATQELLITVSTGRTVQVVLLVACIAGFAVLFNFTNAKRILTGKRIYK